MVTFRGRLLTERLSQALRALGGGYATESDITSTRRQKPGDNGEPAG
jgi:hypothetical protein